MAGAAGDQRSRSQDGAGLLGQPLPAVIADTDDGDALLAGHLAPAFGASAFGGLAPAGRMAGARP
jgi:hypothetical protein